MDRQQNAPLATKGWGVQNIAYLFDCEPSTSQVQKHGCSASEIRLAIRSLIDLLRARPAKTGMESGKIPRPRRRGRPI